MEWEKALHSDGVAFSVRQTSDGGYIIGGSQWVMKTDSIGNEEWRNDFDSGHARSVQQTADGGCVICGWTVDSAGLGEAEAWVMKLDSSGNEEWGKRFGPGDAWSVQQTADGGYIIGAATNCSVDEMGDTDRCDVRVIRIDSSGDLQWEKTFSDPNEGSGLGLSLQQTSDGGYIILASRSGTGSFLTKTNSEGNEMWEKTFEGFRSSSPVQQTSDGGYAFLAQEFSPDSGEFLRRNWLIKTDSSGEEERIKVFNYGYGWSVQESSDGGYIVLAFKDDKGSFLTKTNSTFIEDWEKVFADVDPTSVQQTSDGGYIVVATKCPDLHESTPDDCEVWLIKISGSPRG